MSVDAITTTQNNTAVKTYEEQSILGKDDFLRLFIEQLKNQDPLDPMDDKEFIAQMAQFYSLEQLSNLNKSGQGVLAAQNDIIKHLETISQNVSFNQTSLADYSRLIGMSGYWFNDDGEETAGNIQSLILKNQEIYAVINGYEVLVDNLHKIETGVNDGSNI